MSSKPSDSPLAKFKASFFKRLFENFHGIVLLVCGSGVLLFGAYHAYHHFIVLRSRALYESHLLRRRILSSQKKYKNIIYLNVQKRQAVEDPSGLSFEVILIDNLKKKPDLSENTIKKADPFLPPFEDGQFITEISPTHNLLFNKFALVKTHVLVTTKAHESQMKPLTFLDFMAVAKTMKALEGFAFFNCGPNSGYSVPHKHIQVLPFRSGNYSVFELIRERIKEKTLSSGKENGLYILKEFQFQHVIRLIDSHEDQLEKVAEGYLKSYLKALDDLDNENGQKSYNLILTDEWLLMVMRGKEKALGSAGLNAMAYSGTILVKDEKEMEQIVRMGNPLRILEEISVQ